MSRPFLINLITIVVFLAVVMGVVAYLILLERKMAAWMQDRLGPNRVGPFGLLQPIADGLKFLFKEELIPRHVDRFLYLLAPSIALMTALMAAAVVPFGPTTALPEPPVPLASLPENPTPAEQAQYVKARDAYERQLKEYDKQLAEYQKHYQFVIAPGLDIGILFTFAVGSLAVYGVILGGWSSNNKYSFLGGLRQSAQIISYEVPMGLAIVGVLLYSGSLNLERIIQHQAAHGWNLLFQPLAFLLFLISVFAECNRLPFDLSEAEQELVGGYHTEYSGMKFALFFLGEYAHMITTSLLLTTVFLGGWYLPGISEPSSGIAIKLIVFLTKLLLFILIYMAVRWTIPRFRFDQLMGLAWKVLIPLGVANLVCVMIVRELRLTPWILTLTSLAILIVAGSVALRMPPPTKRVAVRREPLVASRS
jgi:NADH-quinone oxidoreductase subunit H